ncbi:MAG: hypothetical protein AABX38_03370 [Candidatus Micrarchaeota archaeon]
MSQASILLPRSRVLKVPNEKHEELRTVLDRLGFAQSGMIGGLITAHTTMAQVLPEERGNRPLPYSEIDAGAFGISLTQMEDKKDFNFKAKLSFLINARNSKDNIVETLNRIFNDHFELSQFELEYHDFRGQKRFAGYSVPLTIPYLPDDLSTALGLFLIENIELGFRLAQLLFKIADVKMHNSHLEMQELRDDLETRGQLIILAERCIPRVWDE